MACRNVCRLCKNLIISADVTFTAPNLIINIPAGSYGDCEKYCIVVAQTIPASTTINALVNIIVGGTRFPLVKCNCAQATACEIKSRTKYSTKVVTNTVSGTFRLLGPIYCTKPDNLTALPVTEEADA